jgi:hypothetical protein
MFDLTFPWAQGADRYEISGEGARTHEAQITMGEVEYLVQHWAGKLLDVDQPWAYHSTMASPTIQMQLYASVRLSYFKQLLGFDRVGDFVVDTDRHCDEDETRVALVTTSELELLYEHWEEEWRDVHERTLDRRWVPGPMRDRQAHATARLCYLERFLDPVRSSEIIAAVHGFSLAREPVLPGEDQTVSEDPSSGPTW